MFFGLLVCQVIIDRDEIWIFLKQDDVLSTKYFLKRNKGPEKSEDPEVPSYSLDDLKNKFN